MSAAGLRAAIDAAVADGRTLTLSGVLLDGGGAVNL
jgi:hypothetical protein